MTRACPSLTAGSTFDLHADKDGNVYDFLNASDRQRCRDRIRAEKPFMVVGSPPCTWWSAPMSLNIPKMDKDKAARREAEARVRLHFACEIYQYQLENDGHFLHEHPAGARSWSEDRVQRLLADPRVGSIVGHQCRYGQRAMADDGTVMPVRKATRWLSSAPEVLSRLGHKCLGGHRHQALVNGRAAQAAVYPPQLCRAILRGAEAQRRREGHVLPESVVSELAVLGLSSGGPAPAGDPTAVQVSEDLEEYHVGDEEVNIVQHAGDEAVLDEYTGDVLPPELVRKAREEEVAMMEDWEVWEEITQEEAWKLTGRKPPQGQVGGLQQGGTAVAATSGVAGWPRRSPITGATSSSRRRLR